MHEASLAQGLLRTALDSLRAYNAGSPLKRADRITALKVSIGLLSCVEVTTFKGCFELLAEGTACDVAVLEVLMAPLPCDCLACHAKFTLTSRTFRCPHCGSLDLHPLAGGHGLTLLSLEAEQKD